MANTYTLISSNTLTSDTASVSFTSIPSTYTDLVLKWSNRITQATDTGRMKITFNGTSSGYSETFLLGYASSVSSGRTSSAAYFYPDAPGSVVASNIFGSGEMYIPNYASSTYKPLSVIDCICGTVPANDQLDRAFADLWQNTAAISTITAVPNSGNFASGSSFYLYGIKNS